MVAGRLESGPYRTGMLEAMAQFYGSGASASLTTALGAIFKAATGDFAMAMQLAGPKGMDMTQVFGVADAKATDKALGQLLDAFKKPQTMTMMGVAITHTTSPKPTTHDGVAIRGYDVAYDLSKAPQDQRAMMEKMFPKTGVTSRVAIFDQLGVVTASADGAAGAAAAIDAARGKGKRYTPSTQIADFLAGSRARKESVAAVIDLAGITGMGAAGLGIMMSMGFADQRAHLRLALPAATIRGFAGRGP